MPLILRLMFVPMLAASLASAGGESVTVNFQEMKSDTEIEKEINNAVNQILKFSRTNNLEIQKSEQFITKATVYGTKSSFDKFIETSPDWKTGAKVPATYVGFGEKKEFFVVSWSSYQAVHPADTREEYRKLLIHEIAHLFHSAYLNGSDDKMGPVWFYEGFACFAANQYQGAVLPKNFDLVINAPDRGSYRDYVAIFRELRKKHSVHDLLDKAHTKDFNRWVILQLRP